MNFIKIKALLVLFLGIFTSLSFSQTGTTNQFDQNGKKEGKWVVYLDKNWKHISDSTGAPYYRYTFYSHGTNLYPMGPCGGKNYKLETTSNNNDQKGVLKLLDGEYKWLNEKGQLSSTHVFKNGEYVSCKEYYPSGQIHQYFDYTKKSEGQVHGWLLTIYDKKGNVKQTYYFQPDKDGRWPTTRG